MQRNGVDKCFVFQTVNRTTLINNLKKSSKETTYLKQIKQTRNNRILADCNVRAEIIVYFGLLPVFCSIHNSFVTPKLFASIFAIVFSNNHYIKNIK